jgi:hypothetical protein
LRVALLAVMTGQSVLGLTLPNQYRDSAWITATWFGNDWVTLVVAVPILSVALIRKTAGSIRGSLTCLGVTAYAVYNYAFYLFGAVLNVFFPLYVVALVVALAGLVAALSAAEVRRVADTFSLATRARILGGTLVFIGAGLAAVWTSMWASHVFGGATLPVEEPAFRLVAALDLSLMAPALTAGGVLLWRRQPWGFVVAPMASLHAALYLLVLSVNSAVAIRRGLAQAPGELMIWVPLGVIVAAVAISLFVSAGNAADLRTQVRASAGRA